MMGIATLTAATSPLVTAWLAVPPGHYDPASGHGPEWGKATPAGLLIWLFLGLALFFLIKSMNRHIRRVKSQGDSFGSAEPGEGDRDGAGDPAAGSGGGEGGYDADPGDGAAGDVPDGGAPVGAASADDAPVGADDADRG